MITFRKVVSVQLRIVSFFNICINRIFTDYSYTNQVICILRLQLLLPK